VSAVSMGTPSAALRRVMDELIESATPIRVSMSKRPAPTCRLFGTTPCSHGGKVKAKGLCQRHYNQTPEQKDGAAHPVHEGADHE